MTRSLFLPVLACLLILPACSTGKGPKNYQVQCGQPISPADVLLLDMREQASDGDLDFEYVEQQAGPFRLYTEQTVGVQKNTVYASEPVPRGTTRAREHAAVRGCDLLLLVGDVLGAYGNSSNTWQVHLGRRLQ